MGEKKGKGKAQAHWFFILRVGFFLIFKMFIDFRERGREKEKHQWDRT